MQGALQTHFHPLESSQPPPAPPPMGNATLQLPIIISPLPPGPWASLFALYGSVHLLCIQAACVTLHFIYSSCVILNLIRAFASILGLIHLNSPSVFYAGFSQHLVSFWIQSCWTTELCTINVKI